MTQITYFVFDQVKGANIEASTWEEAKLIQQQVMEENIKRLGLWQIKASVLNNNGSTSFCNVNENGAPLSAGDLYVDTTEATKA